MRIKKEYQSTLPDGTVLNTQSDSQTNTYSCDYINNNTPAVLNTKSSSQEDTYSCNYINNTTPIGGLVMAVTAYRSGKPTISNQNIPFNNLTKSYVPSGFGASLASSGVVTLTLPAGNYLAKINASCWTGSNTWDYMLLQIYRGSSVIARAMAPKPSGSWGFVNCEGIAQVTNGQTVSAYLNTNNNSFSDGNIGSADTKMDIMVYKIS